MSKLLLTFVYVALFVFVVPAQNATLEPTDLKPLEGAKWTGTLTYVDYGSGKRTSIKSDLTVTKRDKRTWNFAYIYPDEPEANSAADVLLSADGKVFDEKTVESRTKKNGVVEIVATKRGTDNNKPATFRYTYRIGKKEFSIRKDVLIDGSDKYFERNTYSWRR
jgi:hypothetical protein